MDTVKIIGYGTVGQNTEALLTKCGIDDDYILIDDPKKGYCNKDCADFAFITLGTGNEESDFKQIMNILTPKITGEEYGIDYDTVVVIRTTLLPERYARLVAVHDRIVCFPEFLSEVTSFEDTLNTKNIVVGGEYNNVKKVLGLLGQNSFGKNLKPKICSLEQASWIKYVHNLYSIHKCLFWEMVQDLTKDIGGARFMYDGYKDFKTPDMNIIGLDGYRGIGGKCFPANLEAVKDKHPLLEALYKFDKSLKNPD